jgi:hypothetical protein
MKVSQEPDQTRDERHAFNLLVGHQCQGRRRNRCRGIGEGPRHCSVVLPVRPWGASGLRPGSSIRLGDVPKSRRPSFLAETQVQGFEHT